jgi:hypothetical protein
MALLGTGCHVSVSSEKESYHDLDRNEDADGRQEQVLRHRLWRQCEEQGAQPQTERVSSHHKERISSGSTCLTCSTAPAETC